MNILEEIYRLSIDALRNAPDENECSDAENDMYAELANFVNAYQNLERR